MNTNVTQIELGKMYRDTITGASGVATAHCRYIDETDSVRLERLNSDGDIKEHWIDATRLIPFATEQEEAG